MAGNRRLRLQALLFILVILVIFYVTTAKRSTYASPFYSRTMSAIRDRQDAASVADHNAAEERRSERVARLQVEHDKAMADNAKGDTQKQKPVIAEVKEKVQEVKAAVLGEDVKPVTGRKTMKDGRVVVDESGDSADGVARVGNNVEPKEKETPTGKSKKQSEEEEKAEVEINSILKKGPIIIFSKSYCPYSKKAKNILQKLYTIVPPPFVVELDEHSMGTWLQEWLRSSTGRGTVPNVMINGKSIGGGDDIEQLHNEGKLIETIQSLGGKRIVEISKAEDSQKKKIKRMRA